MEEIFAWLWPIAIIAGDWIWSNFIALAALGLSAVLAFDNWMTRRRTAREVRKPRLEVRCSPLSNTKDVWTCNLIVQNRDAHPMQVMRLALTASPNFRLVACIRVDRGNGEYSYEFSSTRPVDALEPNLQLSPYETAPIRRDGQLRDGSMDGYPFFLASIGDEHTNDRSNAVVFNVTTKILATGTKPEEFEVTAVVVPWLLWVKSHQHRAPSDI